MDDISEKVCHQQETDGGKSLHCTSQHVPHVSSLLHPLAIIHRQCTCVGCLLGGVRTGLTIWQKWHMPRAPRFGGPVLRRFLFISGLTWRVYAGRRSMGTGM